MTPIENPTAAELKSTLKAADGDLGIGKDIEARLGKDADSPAASSPAASSEEE